MTDPIIFKTDGKETHRISPPTSGTKCPETKLEIKMTETDISKVLIEGDYATIMGVKYKRMEEPKSPVEEAYKDWCGEYPSGGPSEVAKWGAFLAGYWVTQPKLFFQELLEVLLFLEILMLTLVMPIHVF